MKIINKFTNELLGVFNEKNVTQEVVALGLNVEDFDFVKSQSEIDCECLVFLQESDWKIKRHRDQRDASHATTLSNNEYLELLNEVQTARDNIVDNNALNKLSAL